MHHHVLLLNTTKKISYNKHIIVNILFAVRLALFPFIQLLSFNQLIFYFHFSLSHINFFSSFPFSHFFFSFTTLPPPFPFSLFPSSLCPLYLFLSFCLPSSLPPSFSIPLSLLSWVPFLREILLFLIWILH